MIQFRHKSQRKIVLLFVLLSIQVSFALAQNSLRVSVDATEAAKNILRVKETIDVQPGELTLTYPKWIPGEHAPTGTINDMVNLFVTANGKLIQWRRDDVEMFAFHLTIPANVKEIEIAFDDVSQANTVATAQFSRVKWNRLLMYPQGAKSDAVKVTASMKMPADWKYATALPVAKESVSTVDFKEVSLETFVDSPAVVGKFFKRVPLGNVNGAEHEIDIFADNAEALEYKPETLEGWKNLVKQANLMFGARHYGSYKFLLTLSDYGGDEGLEHHESSEDGVGEKALSEPFRMIDLADLLGHEYAHSWNGKHRRPIGLATPDFEQPMRGELLWVYEGLTEYLGNVLPARSGLWTAETFREVTAEVAAGMDFQTGRRWRPLVDTATAVQFTYPSPRQWMNERRRVDYYYEGQLIWMDADVLIRQKSNGKLSLDDFMRRFHGGENTGAQLKPYNFDEVVKTLNDVLPFDWRTFFIERVYTAQRNAPLGGITNGGWKLIYNDTPNIEIQLNETLRDVTNELYSIGLFVNADGTIADINPDLSAAKAGLAPAMKITKINGEDFSTENLHKAIAATKTTTSTIEIVAENNASTQTYKINYTGGEKYPHLERDATKPDYLSDVIKPLMVSSAILVNSADPRLYAFGGFTEPRQPRNAGKIEVINKPEVTKILTSKTEISAKCADKNCLTDISTEVFNPENDVITYEYSVSGGKIVGRGAKVVWDLSGVAPGTYTIRVFADDGCGDCGKSITQTVTVVE